MKTIIKIVVAFLFFLNLAIGADFGSSLTVFTRAYEAASYGDYNVSGNGLKEQIRQYVHYKEKVRSTKDLLAPFEFSYLLNFRSYKTTVSEVATIYDKNGNPLFVSEINWQPTETVSPDGKKLSYELPEYHGIISFHLADQKISFDGDYASVELQGGYVTDLEIIDGKIIVPGWLYENIGTFTTWKNGLSSVTDIQTGLKVPGGVEMNTTNPVNVSGVEVYESPGLVLNLNTYGFQYSPVYETTVLTAGSLTVRVRDYWSNAPVGLYYTIVGDGREKQYLLPVTYGEFKIPCLKGQTFQLKFVWSKHPGGGKG